MLIERGGGSNKRERDREPFHRFSLTGVELSKMMKSMLKRRRMLKSKDEIREFEMEVDEFAKSFVGSRGSVPERGTFHVVNLAKKSVT